MSDDLKQALEVIDLIGEMGHAPDVEIPIWPADWKLPDGKEMSYKDHPKLTAGGMYALRERIKTLQRDADSGWHQAEMELIAALATRAMIKIAEQHVDDSVRAQMIAAAEDVWRQHPPTRRRTKTDDLIRDFALAVAQKLNAAREKYGYTGEPWQQPGWMDECRQKLIEHLAKGDPRDVAAYCAFLWFHNERTAA